MSMTDYAAHVDEAKGGDNNRLIDVANDTLKPQGLISHHN
jgi:hypothetical protein